MIDIRQASWKRDKEAISTIRRRVFIDEQRVPEELEWDGLDGDALHLLALDDGHAVATARMLADGHIGRMAVLPEHRRRGIGGRMIKQLLGEAQGMGLKSVYLDAQVQALGFYQRLGFVCHGEVFMDAGIPHRRMDKPL